MTCHITVSVLRFPSFPKESRFPKENIVHGMLYAEIVPNVLAGRHTG